MKQAGLYTITNKLDGTAYVGSSVNVTRRLRDHKNMLRNGKHHSIHLQRAWDRDGEASFEFAMAIALENPDECLIQEQILLDSMKDSGLKVYNVATKTDCSALGRKWSEETRSKLKDQRASQWDDPKKRAKMSVVLSAVKGAEEARAAHTAKMRAYWESPKGLARRLAKTPLSEEHKRKIGESSKGRVKSAAEREKLSRAHKGRIFSETHIQNIRIAQQKRRKNASLSTTTL
jgi:group I intron endonuclease